jgi:hypothetical protein
MVGVEQVMRLNYKNESNLFLIPLPTVIPTVI